MRSQNMKTDHLRDASVLIADSNRSAAEATEKTLAAWNCRCKTVFDADAALQALLAAVAEKDPFQVAIIDHSLLEARGSDLKNTIHNNPDLAKTTLVTTGNVGGASAVDPQQEPVEKCAHTFQTDPANGPLSVPQRDHSAAGTLQATSE